MLVSIYHDIFNDEYVELASLNAIDRDNAVYVYEREKTTKLVHHSTVSDDVTEWAGSILVPTNETKH